MGHLAGPLAGAGIPAPLWPGSCRQPDTARNWPLSGPDPATDVYKRQDLYAAEIVLELKEQYPQITLECAIPYERQAVRWPAALRERYFSIAERCDKETMLQRQYTRDCMKKRNQYMVDCADVVLAVWNGEPSGTGQTVWYAKEKGKLVWRIDPATLGMEF